MWSRVLLRPDLDRRVHVRRHAILQSPTRLRAKLRISCGANATRVNKPQFEGQRTAVGYWLLAVGFHIPITCSRCSRCGGGGDEHLCHCHSQQPTANSQQPENTNPASLGRARAGRGRDLGLSAVGLGRVASPMPYVRRPPGFGFTTAGCHPEGVILSGHAALRRHDGMNIVSTYVRGFRGDIHSSPQARLPPPRRGAWGGANLGSQPPRLPLRRDPSCVRMTLGTRDDTLTSLQVLAPHRQSGGVR
jgi:hypothetical protein